MPIPVATAQDAFLRALLDEQVKLGIDGKVAVEDVVKGLSIDMHETVCPNGELPSALVDDIEHLERLRLLEFFPSNPHVRLTPMGIYTALLFNKVERKGQSSAATAALSRC